MPLRHDLSSHAKAALRQLNCISDMTLKEFVDTGIPVDPGVIALYHLSKAIACGAVLLASAIMDADTRASV